TGRLPLLPVGTQRCHVGMAAVASEDADSDPVSTEAEAGKHRWSPVRQAGTVLAPQGWRVDEYRCAQRADGAACQVVKALTGKTVICQCLARHRITGHLSAVVHLRRDPGCRAGDVAGQAGRLDPFRLAGA